MGWLDDDAVAVVMQLAIGQDRGQELWRGMRLGVM